MEGPYDGRRVHVCDGRGSLIFPHKKEMRRNRHKQREQKKKKVETVKHLLLGRSTRGYKKDPVGGQGSCRGTYSRIAAVGNERVKNNIKYIE